MILRGDNMMAIEEKSNKYMFKKVEGELYGYYRDLRRKEVIKEEINTLNNMLEKIDKNIQAEEAYQKAEKYILEKQYDKALFYARKALSLKSKHTNRLTDIVILCERWNPPIYSE